MKKGVVFSMAFDAFRSTPAIRMNCVLLTWLPDGSNVEWNARSSSSM